MLGVNAAAVELNRGMAPDPANPHSWLVLQGHGDHESGPGGYRVLSGTLRPEHRHFRPSLAAFVQAKLAVAVGSDAPAWTVTAYRHEVLLPVHAGDRLRCPRTLIETFEREQPPEPKALAAYVTLTSRPERLHACYEVARALGRRIADAHEVAVVLIQHVPALAGSSSAPHCHLVVPGPRALTAWSGFGGFVSELAGDRMRGLVLGYLAELV